MRTRKTTLLLATALLGAFVATAAATTTATIYTNPLHTKPQVTEMRHVVRFGAPHCGKSVRSGHMQMTVGSSTTECNYSPPVVASCDAPPCAPNYTLVANAALSTKTGKTLRKQLFTSVGVRLTKNTGGGVYRLDVLSQGKKWRLRHYAEAKNGAHSQLLASNHAVSFIRQPPKGNKLRITISGATGTTGKLSAWINDHRVASGIHVPNIRPGPRVAITLGRDSGGAKGAIAAFSNLIVRSTF